MQGGAGMRSMLTEVKDLTGPRETSKSTVSWGRIAPSGFLIGEEWLFTSELYEARIGK